MRHLYLLTTKDMSKVYILAKHPIEAMDVLEKIFYSKHKGYGDDKKIIKIEWIAENPTNEKEDGMPYLSSEKSSIVVADDFFYLKEDVSIDKWQEIYGTGQGLSDDTKDLSSIPPFKKRENFDCKKNINNYGDVRSNNVHENNENPCPICGKRTTLMSGYITLEPDAEPYKIDKEEESNVGIIERDIIAFYCEHCDKVVGVSDE